MPELLEPNTVSLVIPAYNAAETIEAAMLSAINQTYQNLKIVVVDDGSLDDTGEKTEKIAQNHSDREITVIHTVNRGAMAARLAGALSRDAEYIAFLDSDDVVSPEFVENMVSDIEGADIAIEDAELFQDRTSRTIKNLCAAGFYKKDAERERLYKKMICWNLDGPYEFGVLPFLCNKLFKRSILLPILQKANFSIGDGDDVAILYPYLLKASAIRIGTQTDYKYLISEGSLSRSHKKDSYVNASRLYIQLFRVFAESKYQEILLPQINQYFRMMIQKEDPFQYLTLNHFLFPYRKVLPNSEIVLYGAGSMGKTFFCEIQKNHYCRIVKWVDRDPRSFTFQGETYKQNKPEAIYQCDFDYLLIAIADSRIVESIKKNLVSHGVPEEKIIICAEYQNEVISQDK